MILCDGPAFPLSRFSVLILPYSRGNPLVHGTRHESCTRGPPRITFADVNFDIYHPTVIGDENALSVTADPTQVQPVAIQPDSEEGHIQPYLIARGLTSWRSGLTCGVLALEGTYQ